MSALMWIVGFSLLLIGWAERDVGLSLMGLGMVITGSVDMAVDKMKRPR